MDTATANGAPPAPPADRHPLPGAPDGRQAPSAPPARRYTRQEAAAELGISLDVLRRLQKRADVPGELVPAERGGTVCELTGADLAALRLAAATRQPPTAPAERQARPAPPAERQPPADGDAAGWREALARADAEADRLRSQLEAERVARQEALRHAAEAERARHTAAEQLEALRGAWWRWYALATARGVWARLRGRLPEPPAEMTADKRLTTTM